ncbi:MULTISPECIES: GNVR domain-containing protein [unclassified Mesorhizobium]|uniref:GumC family protein n=1 Tax=unclassified Mesorhizobium TaxID=325217 RepID=UPI0010938D58|nr:MULTISPECIES: GNVR domain-containing protein [unclassified Mesorhizobium]TGT87597.1 succinoglycan biosynthesis protein exop [Mesorhizobium sp. M8A.F.Ca.ET.161.01.1.1]TGV41472.1 succinoglycan biosynthesis protein exop [Mesorhizobium sp. M8A.F.Ca.ET.142.01.1.1]
MVDRENREDWKRERSLLALGDAVRGEDDASLVSIGDRADPSWREDAATRHRLARSRRETKASPPRLAAGDAAPFPPDGEQPVEADAAWRSRAETGAGDLPPDMPRARPAPEEPSGTGRARDAIGSRATDGADTSSDGGADDQQWKPLIDPMLVVRGVARSKLLIVATTILGAGLGIAIALSMPKKYEATTELIIEPGDLKLSDRDLTQPVGQPDAALAVVETRIKMLTSGTVLDQVVKNLNLVNDPEFNGQGSGGLGVMSLIRSIVSRHDGPGGVDEVRRQALAVGNLAKSLSVERTGKTFVISVSAVTQNGEKSALIANTTRTVFQQEAAKYQSDMAGRATNELTSKLDDLRKGVEAAERKVEDFRATHGLVDAQGHLISDDQMLKLNEQLSVARARTLELNARAASARSLDVNSVLTGTLPEEINSNTMSDLRSQYATLKQEADRAAVRLGPRHPELQALDAQIAGARERIANELRRIASSLQVDLKRAVQLEQDLASRLAQAKVQSGDVNSDLVALRELEREATAKRSVYEQYLLRAKETGEQTGINTTNINVITSAQAPLEPNGPSRALVALAGLLLGFGAGVGLGALRGTYDSLRETASLRSRRERKPNERKLHERKLDEQRAPLEAQAFRPEPPPAPPMPTAPVPPRPAPPPATRTEAAPAEGSGRIGALMSRLRKAMSRKPSAEADGDISSEFALPAFADNGRPANAPIFPGYPEPGFGPRQTAGLDYSQSPFQPGAEAGYGRQMASLSRSPLMPQQAIYPAPPLPSSPYAQPMGYPPAQPRSQPGYPYTQPTAGPYAAQMSYPPPAPTQQPAHPAAHARPTPVEEDGEQSSVEEIRASLREFREAVRELTENRTRRRYF